MVVTTPEQMHRIAAAPYDSLAERNRNFRCSLLGGLLNFLARANQLPAGGAKKTG
jgi:hypothetical protein